MCMPMCMAKTAMCMPRAEFLTFLVTVHIFLSFLCLELHCLGAEALQQTRMLGEWRRIAEPVRELSRWPERSAEGKQKAAEWSCQSCPYPRGAPRALGALSSPFRSF